MLLSEYGENYCYCYYEQRIIECNSGGHYWINSICCKLKTRQEYVGHITVVNC